VVIGVVTAISGLLLLGAAVYYFFWRNKASTKRQAKMPPISMADVPPGARKHSALRTAQDRRMNESRMSAEKDLDLPLFDLEVILAATDNFSADSKIGQGGFGPVYMVGFKLSNSRTTFFS
jgi:hypothetical protein